MIINSNNISYYDWNELEQTPDAPGLYSWYVSLHIGRADMSDINEWRSQLEHFAEQHRRPSLSVNANAHFGLEFSGNLEHRVSTGEYLIASRTSLSQSEVRTVSD